MTRLDPLSEQADSNPTQPGSLPTPNGYT